MASSANDQSDVPRSLLPTDDLQRRESRREAQYKALMATVDDSHSEVDVSELLKVARVTIATKRRPKSPECC